MASEMETSYDKDNVSDVRRLATGKIAVRPFKSSRASTFGRMPLHVRPFNPAPRGRQQLLRSRKRKRSPGMQTRIIMVERYLLMRATSAPECQRDGASRHVLATQRHIPDFDFSLAGARPYSTRRDPSSDNEHRQT